MQRVKEHEAEIRKTMEDGEIQAVSIASGSDKDKIDTLPIGDHPERFGAASLSKPVFTYLVLKLISAGELKLDTNLNEAVKYDEATKQDKKVLSFADFCKNVGINWIDSNENRDRINKFTPAMILSHQTGLPIGYNDSPDPKYDGKPAPLEFDFEPGKGYAYSGLHLMYLQQWIKEKTGRELDDLAWEFVFDKTKANMPNSSFKSPKGQNAANSLYTTAEDYARFCIHWMNDPDPLVQQAFVGHVSLKDDPWAVREKVSPDTLEHLDWGYGWGLEKDDHGKVIGAFHTGDMNEWRSGVKLDLVEKTATVFFSKSTYQNGHLLQEKIFGKSPSLDYFFDKFKFARDAEELKSDWRENRSYGIRKEPAQSPQAKEGPASQEKVDSSRRMLQTRYSAVAKKAVPPKPAVSSKPNASNPSSASSQQQDSQASSTYSSPKPSGYSTKLTRDPTKK